MVCYENYESETVKYRRAVELNQNGKNIIILSGSQFDRIIGI